VCSDVAVMTMRDADGLNRQLVEWAVGVSVVSGVSGAETADSVSL